VTLSAPAVPAAQELMRELVDWRLAGRSEFLRSYFRTVLCADEGMHFLPTDELMNALSSANRAELIIGGAASERDEAADRKH
jgi:hypothetical protein